MPTVEDLRNYVGALPSDDAFLMECLSQASALVSQYTHGSTVPMSVLEGVLLQVGAELFNRRNAPSGIAQFSSLDGTPMRVAKDPLTSSYALLNRYITGGV